MSPSSSLGLLTRALPDSRATSPDIIPFGRREMSDPCSYSYEESPLLGILLLVAGIFFMYGAFGNTGASRMFKILAGIIAASGPLLAAGIADTYNQTAPKMDPQIILSLCKDEWNSLRNAESEIERLEIVYENAVNVSRKALFMDS